MSEGVSVEGIIGSEDSYVQRTHLHVKEKEDLRCFKDNVWELYALFPAGGVYGKREYFVNVKDQSIVGCFDGVDNKCMKVESVTGWIEGRQE